MSARDRTAAYRQARTQGHLAGMSGADRDSCPYKEGGNWSLRPFWMMGYNLGLADCDGEGVKHE